MNFKAALEVLGEAEIQRIEGQNALGAAVWRGLVERVQKFHAWMKIPASFAR